MIHPDQLVGTWRRFGSVGPVYEIIANGHDLPPGGHVMRVRVLEPGKRSIAAWPKSLKIQKSADVV